MINRNSAMAQNGIREEVKELKMRKEEDGSREERATVADPLGTVTVMVTYQALGFGVQNAIAHNFCTLSTWHLYKNFYISYFYVSIIYLYSSEE
jgi:hypothetical protein